MLEEDAVDYWLRTGDCETVTRRYTRNVDWTTVRPPEVLEAALAEIIANAAKEDDWAWQRDQFKSIRQDLTVQRVLDLPVSLSLLRQFFFFLSVLLLECPHKIHLCRAA